MLPLRGERPGRARDAPGPAPRPRARSWGCSESGQLRDTREGRAAALERLQSWVWDGEGSLRNIYLLSPSLGLGRMGRRRGKMDQAPSVHPSAGMGEEMRQETRAEKQRRAWKGHGKAEAAVTHRPRGWQPGQTGWEAMLELQGTGKGSRRGFEVIQTGFSRIFPT